VLKLAGVMAIFLALLIGLGTIFLSAILFLDAGEKSREIDRWTATGRYAIDQAQALSALVGVPLPTDLPSLQSEAASAKQRIWIQPFVVLLGGLLVSFVAFGFGAMFIHIAGSISPNEQVRSQTYDDPLFDEHLPTSRPPRNTWRAGH
jgi:hypothetical protein